MNLLVALALVDGFSVDIVPNNTFYMLYKFTLAPSVFTEYPPLSPSLVSAILP